MVVRIAVSQLGARLFSYIAHPLDRLTLWLTQKRYSLTLILTGIPIVMLTTRGARSGKLRRVPLLGFRDGKNIGLIASNWGGARHPGWYYNLSANPDARLWMAGTHMNCAAREANTEERTRIWSSATGIYPGYETYALRANRRRIPVLVLEPRD
jgi:deazaflavin-dependent oxidoreductase (nitroreductase family)